MGKSLLICCEQLYLIVSDIRKRAIQIDADFFEVLKESFEQFEKNASAQGFYQVDIQLSKYALVALIDELISHYYPNVQHNWPARSLQLYYYQSNIAGNLFFENLNELLLAKKGKPISLEVYYFCLNLGFKGQYREHLYLLDEYKQRVKLSIESELTVGQAQDSRDRRIPLWMLWVATLVFMLLLYFIFVVCISAKIFSVSTALNTYAEQLQDA